MNSNKIKISLGINIIIIILVIVASVMMFTGFRFMQGAEIVLESTKLGMLRFFTVESNLFMGVAACIFGIKEIKLIKGKIQEISKRSYILKLMATTGVGLTCFVVFAYLGPISTLGVSSLLKNSSLFFHLIIPVLSLLNFIIFEKTDKLKYKDKFYGLIPTLIYGCYYLINVLIHMENGQVSVDYDWYWFVQNGVWTAIIVVPIIFIITYIISLILWRLNKEKQNKSI